MVQGETHGFVAKSEDFNNISRKSGFEALQKKEAEKKQQAQNGAWGSTFKNRNHFANMHFC